MGCKAGSSEETKKTELTVDGVVRLLVVLGNGERII